MGLDDEDEVIRAFQKQLINMHLKQVQAVNCRQW